MGFFNAPVKGGVGGLVYGQGEERLGRVFQHPPQGGNPDQGGRDREVSSLAGPVHRHSIGKTPFEKLWFPSPPSLIVTLASPPVSPPPVIQDLAAQGGDEAAFIVLNTLKMPPTVFAFVPVLVTWLRKTPLIERPPEASENPPPVRGRPVQVWLG